MPYTPGWCINGKAGMFEWVAMARHLGALLGRGVMDLVVRGNVAEDLQVTKLAECEGRIKSWNGSKVANEVTVAQRSSTGSGALEGGGGLVSSSPSPPSGRRMPRGPVGRAASRRRHFEASGEASAAERQREREVVCAPSRACRSRQCCVCCVWLGMVQKP